MRRAWVLCILAGITLQLHSQCNELFITEYYSGKNGNRAIEIFNPALTPVDLSLYRITCWRNGTATWSADFSDTLEGFIPANAAWVLLPDLRDTSGTVPVDVMDTMLAAKVNLWVGKNNSAMDFDGDDALSLDKLIGGVFLPVDIIGKIGERPESVGQTGGYLGWTDSFPFHTGIGTDYTKNACIRRKYHINRGVNLNPAYFDPTKEWVRISQVQFDSLGTHVSNCNKFPASVDEPLRASIEIFPNPAYDEIVVISEVQSGTVIITDYCGRQQKALAILAGSGKVIVDIRHLTAGSYMAVIKSDQRVIQMPFIKL